MAFLWLLMVAVSPLDAAPIVFNSDDLANLDRLDIQATYHQEGLAVPLASLRMNDAEYWAIHLVGNARDNQAFNGFLRSIKSQLKELLPIDRLRKLKRALAAESEDDDVAAEAAYRDNQSLLDYYRIDADRLLDEQTLKLTATTSEGESGNQEAINVSDTVEPLALSALFLTQDTAQGFSANNRFLQESFLAQGGRGLRQVNRSASAREFNGQAMDIALWLEAILDYQPGILTWLSLLLLVLLFVLRQVLKRENGLQA